MKTFTVKTLIGMLLLLHSSSQSAVTSANGGASSIQLSKEFNSNKNTKKKNQEGNKDQKHASANEAVSGQYVSVKNKSHFKFTATAKMLGVTSEVTGQFSDFSVSATKNPDLEKSAVTVTIAVKSIDTDNARRDRHLKKPDFFDEEKYKNIIFKSKKIRHLKDNRFEVNGDVEIKNKSTNITFEVVVEQTKTPANAWRIKGEKKFNRNQLGIDYKSPFYLPDVGDEITVHFDVVLSLKQPKATRKQISPIIVFAHLFNDEK